MKSEVYGEVKLDVSTPVEATSEELGLLEANYKLDADRIIHSELLVTDLNGKIHSLIVHNLDVINLDKYLED